MYALLSFPLFDFVLQKFITLLSVAFRSRFLIKCYAIPFFRFGCCSDGETTADGPDGEGCDENKKCDAGKFGCCPDGKTFKQGPKNQGCFECPEEVTHSAVQSVLNNCLMLGNLTPSVTRIPSKK